MDFMHLFKISYWLDAQPFPVFTLGPYLFALFLLSVGLGALAQRYLTIRKKQLLVVSWKRAISVFYTVGFWGLLLLFFRHEGIPYLTMRLWYLFLAIYVAIVLTLIVKDGKNARTSQGKRRPIVKNKYGSVRKRLKKRKRKK